MLCYSVTSINLRAFQECPSLTAVTIPDSVTSIGFDAFMECYGLTSVTIGSGITSIDDNCFYRCLNLSSITIHATTPPTLGTNVFLHTNDCPIYVPDSAVNAYKTATNWSTWASRIKPLSEYVEPSNEE